MIFHINESSNTQFVTSTRSGNTGFVNDPSTVEQNRINDSSSTHTDAQNSTRNTKRVATTIVLYMPNEITTNYKVDWETAEMGVAGDVIDKFNADKSWADVVKSMGASATKNAGNWLNSFTNTNLRDALSLENRLVINNHLEVIFNGILFRDFHFNFRFAPQSEAEAVNVDNIIRAFKFYSAPEVRQGTSGRFWVYPGEFDLQYYSNGQPNDFLNKISTCVLTNMAVNYTPVGEWAAHRPYAGGLGLNGCPPVVTDITLTFTEVELMTKQRVLEGY
jgi:hypothetical protein